MSRETVSEAAALVSKEVPGPVSYTMEGGRLSAKNESGIEEDEEGVDEVDFVDTEVSVLSHFHEDAISQAGFGCFQWILLLVVGLGLAADTVELFVVAYVLPSAEVELCLDDFKKGWLGAITFFGMMIGGFVWGGLADRLGRRRTLLSSLSVNAAFGAIAAFMPTYGTFMTSRLCSGIGIGGSLPIVFAYFSEFLTRKDRGRHMSWLLMAWAIGGVFVALMAWAIIPKTGVMVVENEKEHFSRWREFLLVCSLPSFLAVIGLIFMPESPRFLLDTGRDVEAMMVYQKIYKSNHAGDRNGHYSLSELELPVPKPPSRKIMPPPAPGNSALADFIYSLETFWGTFFQLFTASHRRATLVLLIVWFTEAFGFYGLSIWFPDYIKALKMEQYDENSTVIQDQHFHGPKDNFYNTTVENIRYAEASFLGVNFTNVVLNHVVFDSCYLQDCKFTNILSSKTFFRNSTLIRPYFSDTDIYEYRFINSTLINETIVALVGGCQVDFDYNFHLREVFLENLIGQVSIIPGSLLSVFLLDRIGRVKMICISTFLSAAAAFFIWFLSTEVSVMVFESIFNFIFICGWNAVDIATTEIYPTHLRTTGYGFLSAVCRIGGILGSLTFGSFIGISRAIPMVTTAGVLVVGAFAALKLPETKDVLM